MPQKAPQNADLRGIDTLPSPFCRMVHNPEKRSKTTPSTARHSRKIGLLGKPCPQTRLYSLCSQKATIQLAGFRNIYLESSSIFDILGLKVIGQEVLNSSNLSKIRYNPECAWLRRSDQTRHANGRYRLDVIYHKLVISSKRFRRRSSDKRKPSIHKEAHRGQTLSRYPTLLCYSDRGHFRFNILSFHFIKHHQHPPSSTFRT